MFNVSEWSEKRNPQCRLWTPDISLMPITQIPKETIGGEGQAGGMHESFMVLQDLV